MNLDRSCNRFGPVWLAPGISIGNAWAFMFASFIGIGFLTFVNVGQAYILSEHLGIPGSEQGAISGNLAFVTEIVVLALVGGFGVTSDRIGRRPVLMLGLLAMAIAYVFYPLAGSVGHLTGYRMIYAAGIAACTGMLGTIVNDYPQDISRGRMIALGGIFNAIGIVAVNGLFGRLPDLFVGQGFDAVAAGRYTHWIAAAILAPSAILLAVTLKRGTPARKEERPSISVLIKSGLREGRNPRIALAYLSAFVARSDLVVLGTFLVLWGTLAGVDQGLSTADAVKRGTILFIVAQGAGLIWMPVMGWIIDRVDRVTALAIGAFLAATGFLSMGLIDNPLDSSQLHFFILVGVGQVSCFFASQALIGQEAPLEKRGSVIGVFGFCGAFGILIATLVGGQLFDAWMRAGPFVLVGAANVIIFVLAVLVKFRHRRMGGTVTT